MERCERGVLVSLAGNCQAMMALDTVPHKVLLGCKVQEANDALEPDSGCSAVWQCRYLTEVKLHFTFWILADGFYHHCMHCTCVSFVIVLRACRMYSHKFGPPNRVRPIG